MWLSTLSAAAALFAIQSGIASPSPSRPPAPSATIAPSAAVAQPAARQQVSEPTPAVRTTLGPAPQSALRTTGPVGVRAQGAKSVPPAIPPTSLKIALPPAIARAKLDAVRADVIAHAGEHPVVVFDVDDTLLSWPTPAHPSREPLPGAVSYVKSLAAAGATVVYLTGRKESLRSETASELRDAGFPLGDHERLLLRPSPSTTPSSVLVFKTLALRQIVKQIGTPIALFDNEMPNVRMFRKELPRPDVAVFRLRSTSEADDPGGSSGPIHVIDDFAPAAP